MIEYKVKLKTFVVKEFAADYNTCVDTPSKVVGILRSLYDSLDLDRNQEHLLLLTLNTKMRAVGYKLISSGNEQGTLCSPMQVFRAALILGGCNLVLCHNHPSGMVEPSEPDLLLTRNCEKLGKQLGIPLADHIILDLQSDNYCSIRDKTLHEISW